MKRPGEGNGQRQALPAWYRELNAYQEKSKKSAVIQIADSFLPYFALWGLMIYLVNGGYPYWMTFIASMAAACFLVRIFILFHDCCHGSFFKARRANEMLGYIAGILSFTPYHAWRISHLKHHATNGQLDHRGEGDIWTMTTEEYRNAPFMTKALYRFYRTPVVMFFLGPILMFIVLHRFSGLGGSPKERTSVILTNLAIGALIVLAGFAIGFGTFFLIQLPVILMAGTMGIWLFYVQHQFDPGYWARDREWNPIEASLKGSSHYRLPRILQWLSGNIGLHTIHHLKPGIPNYRLQECYDATPELQEVHPLTFRESLRSLRMHLWSEERNAFVSFREARSL